jgi:hypothetical protein
MIGRHRALLAVAGDLLAADIGEDPGIGAELEDEALCRLATAVLGRQRDQSAQDRRDIGRRRDLPGQRHAGKDLARRLGQPLLGQRHQVDHAHIGLFRRGAHREDAVLQQDQPLDIGILPRDFVGFLGECEAWHHVGHQGGALAVDVGRERLAIGLVGQRQHGVGMGVVDELVRQEGVQQRLDRRVGRLAVQKVAALDVDHVLVGKRLQPDQLAQRFEPHRRQAGRLDRAHVPATALDAQHLDWRAGDVRHLGLHRGIAAAMQHQPRLAAQEPRRVHAQRQILANALGSMLGNRGLGVAVGPQILHRCSLQHSPHPEEGAERPSRRVGSSTLSVAHPSRRAAARRSSG